MIFQDTIIWKIKGGKICNCLNPLLMKDGSKQFGFIRIQFQIYDKTCKTKNIIIQTHYILHKVISATASSITFLLLSKDHDL